jgi:hypothetical protein
MIPGSAEANGFFPNSARGAAARYLDLGLAPVPVPHARKACTLTGWPDLRLDGESLNEHFPKGKRLNVAILNGSPSGRLADVDLDCSQARRAAPLLLPGTGWIFGRKSARRSHWFYRATPAPSKKAEEFKDLDGRMLVELRGDRSATIFPPSTHEETGQPIEWEKFDAPAEVALADLRSAVAAVAAASLLARHWPEKGSRQEVALALAGAMLRAGWEVERTARFVEAVAVAARDEEADKRAAAVAPTAAKLSALENITGWPRFAALLGEQGEAVFQRVKNWLGIVDKEALKATVRQLPPYEQFPVATLPEPIRSFVVEGAAALGCDPSFLALPALAAVASAIGNTRTIRLKRGWDEPAVVWSVIVGDSGTLKSPAWLKSVAHLFHVQKQRLDTYREQYRDYQAVIEGLKGKKKDPAALDPAPEPPVFQRVVCSDVTVEKLAAILEDNPRGLLVARDELSGWLGGFSRYKAKGAGSDLPHWLEMHRAGAVIVDRKTGDKQHYFVPRAAVSVCGGIQPGTLARSMTPEFLDAGLAARVLMAMPPKTAKRWTEAEVSPVTEAAYHGLLDRLLALDLDAAEDGRPVPFVLTLKAPAKESWVQFFDAWASEQDNSEGELAAAFSKLEGYSARFALLHHVVTHVGQGINDRQPVGLQSVEAGVALARWFGNETRRIYATFSESREERDTRRLVEFIRARGERITVKALQRSNSRKFPTASLAELALEALVNAGLATWRDRPPPVRGGRPTRDCVLISLPTPDETDETSAVPTGGDNHAPDETPDETPPDPRISSVLGGFVGIVNGRAKKKAAGEGEEGRGGFVGPLGGFVGQAAKGEDGQKGDTWEGEIP